MLQSIWPASGATRARCSKRANCWLRFTGGSRKGFDTRDLKEAKALLEELACVSARTPSDFHLEGPSAYLTIQFLEWLSERPRTYGETMDAWRTSCPRLSIWEDALSAGLVRLGHGVFRATAGDPDSAGPHAPTQPLSQARGVAAPA